MTQPHTDTDDFLDESKMDEPLQTKRLIKLSHAYWDQDQPDQSPMISSTPPAIFVEASL